MQATRQMLESGDWIHIRFQDEPRNKKPIGIYWLQAMTVSVMGQSLATPWPYRLPSALAAWLAVLVTFHCGRRLFSLAGGLAAATVLATSFIVVAEAHIAKTDAALLAATTLSLAMLGELYVRPRETKPPLLPALLFWLGLGVGILIKGPIIALVVGATITALAVADRNLDWLSGLRPTIGIPLMLAVVLPWLITVSSGEQGSFIADSLRQDLLPKLTGGQESHGAPPGSYIAAALLTAWPWSALAPFVVIAAWRERKRPPIRFCLGWLIPAWIIFEIVPTKLPHYTLPLYPALALLIGWALSHESGGMSFLRSIGAKTSLAYRTVWACFTLALGAGVIFASHMFGDGSFTGAIGVAIAAVAGGIFVLTGFQHRATRSCVAGFTAIGIVLAVSLTSSALPHLRLLAISPRLAEAVGRHGTGAPAALVGFHEPSAVFLLGTRTLLTGTAGAAAHILANPGALAIVPTDTLDALRTALAAGGHSLGQFEAVEGYNYSRGEWLHLAVVTAAEPLVGRSR